MINIEKDKYIIVELIPSHSDYRKGDVVQLSALKLYGLQLIDRFDYRLDEKLIENKDLLNLISYDKDSFKYTSDKTLIMKEFKKWSEKIPLLIIDNDYTKDYLSKLENNKESIFNYLGMTISNDVFDKIMNKYHLEPSDHLVDLLYESLIMESNNK